VKATGLVLMSTRTLDRKFPAPVRDIDYVLDRREALSTLLEAIPPSHREAVRLFYLEDLPTAEAAGMVGVSEERLGEILRDAQRAMREEAKARFPALCANGKAR
jgi:DNA-directed RNA polymerase specialized sigma24 family protein